MENETIETVEVVAKRVRFQWAALALGIIGLGFIYIGMRK